MSSQTTPGGELDPYLTSVPVTAEDLLNPDQVAATTPRRSVEAIIQAGYIGGAINAALTALGETSFIVDNEMAGDIETELSRGAVEADEAAQRRFVSLSAAIERRVAAQKLLSKAYDKLNKDYTRDHYSTASGRTTQIPDADKVGILYDRTEEHDGHPAIAILVGLRNNTGKMAEEDRMTAERIIRVMFADKITLVEVDPVDDEAA